MERYAKGIVAALTAAAVAVSTLVAADSVAGKVTTVALAALGAVGVVLVPNRPNPRAAKRRPADPPAA